jgi:hypothetical protein
MEILSQKPHSVAPGKSSLGRPRPRRDEDLPLTFGNSRSKLSSEVAQTQHSGLGAALLSVFDEIVAHDSNPYDDPAHDFDGASIDNEEQRNVNLDDEVSTLDSEPEKGTFLSHHVESAESSNLNGTSEALVQFEDMSQSNAIPREMFVSESSAKAVPPLRNKPSSPPIMTDAADDPREVVPPIQGVATPRRAKFIFTGQDPLDVTKSICTLSSSMHEELQSEHIAEMDM